MALLMIQILLHLVGWIDENSSHETERWRNATLTMKGYNDMSVAAAFKRSSYEVEQQMGFAVIAIKL